MTREELNDYVFICGAIKEYECRLDMLYGNADGIHSSAFKNVVVMSSKNADNLCNNYEAVIDDIDVCRSELVRLQEKKNTCDAFFGSIRPEYVRQIFVMRYKLKMTWGQIAAKLGGGNTKDTVKQTCYRYLKSH